MSEKERRVTAFREMGHALVAHFLENTDPVHKISVISRGQALGYTISLPTEDKFLTTRAEALRHDGHDPGRPRRRGDRVRRSHHRRVNDLEKVTATAKQMVMRFGMSEKLGPRVFGHDHGQPFLGREFSSGPTTRTRSPGRSTTRSGTSRRPTRRPARCSRTSAKRST